ncbi:c-type cytochrome biogenesis protein CcmI [Pelagovum pacificum]|uniref:C-type cytochrome biogenesis protein CcmI n=1 Tax=Pelagovum pacificum TaxID=2588711 RepID=A0A5C5GBJ5_9RHOB|nr:c-type cytochrome biogenesis protein CcmI [Pelagovum pacificum]QQA41272.1 c-type cytochrome biogenesis protein CcmI [Pelagovum pacificum]TNY31920.1 c-type cytochrome biogenesis protein CcmI [Pelagovum pacificum]
MLFFLICAVMAIAVTATLVLPLLRDPPDDAAAGSDDVELYKAQLAEVDRDIARGVLAEEEGERTRTEIARRLLAADRAGRRPVSAAPSGITRIVAVATAVVVLGGGAVVYGILGAFDGGGPYRDLPRAARIAASAEMRDTRPSQETLQQQAPAFEMPEVDADYAALIEQLRAAVPQRPEELQGWLLLTQHESSLGNWEAALDAQQNVMRLRGDAATDEDRVLLLDLMVAAADGVVSPEAEQLATEMLDDDPDAIAARYYMGLLYAQTDRPDVAFRLWRPLAESAPPENLHARLARSQIERAAFLAGVNYTPPEAPLEIPEEQREMVAGMVASLANRLAEDGGPATDWARLITSYGVLGEEDNARAVLAEAREVFAASPADMEAIEAAAREAGIE